MNILFFTRLFHPYIGGVEKHVLEVSKLLIKKGHKVTVVTEELSTKDIPIYLELKRQLPRDEAINKIKVYRIPVGGNNWFFGKLGINIKKFKIWFWLWKHRELIKDADIVHAHDVFFWYLPFRFLYFKKPIFTTFHGYESYPLKLKQILMHKVSERLSMGNICIGDFMKKWYGTKPDYISYGGAGISNVKNQSFDPLRTKIKNGAVFIGRLDEQTGIKTYVNAVKMIKNKFPNFKFVVLGDGKFRKDIEKEVEVLGFKKNPEKYFSQYRFGFVSRYLSILEAMACKKLVFAVYDNPLKEDYLRMSPFSQLINIVGSQYQLAERALHFLKNPKEEETIVKEAFEWVKKQTWEEMVNTYLKLWK